MSCCKVGYASFDIATNAMYFLQSRCIANNKPVPIRVYFCNKCSRWHITSQPKEDFVKKLEESRSRGGACDFLVFINQMVKGSEQL